MIVNGVRSATQKLIGNIKVRALIDIESVEQIVTSTEDNGENVIEVRKSDGTSHQFSIYNGSKGSKGDKGDQGKQGIQGEQGIQGVSGVYVGEGDMPEGYNVQIDPSGEIEEYATPSYVDDKMQECQEILFAVYGQTPFIDMYNAYTFENKMIFLRQSSGAQWVFTLSHVEYNRLYFARTLDSNKTVEEITVTRQNVWSSITKTKYDIQAKERKTKVVHINAESTLRLQVGHSYLIQCRSTNQAVLTDNTVTWLDGPLKAKWMQITVGGLNDSIDGVSITAPANKAFFLAMGENRIDEETNTWGDRNIRRGVAYCSTNSNAYAEVVIPADSYLTDTYTE